MGEGEFQAVPKIFKIDIGADGGTLEIDQTRPVIQYRINGEQADEAQAWEWVYHWHTKRDETLGADPCGCSPCSWFRSELRLKEINDAE
jgi:hypothetical protein